MGSHNRSQHFVSRFYLARFAFPPERRAIGVFNLKVERYIRCASVKDQACRVYFYGVDNVVERRLGILEGAVAPVFRKIESRGLAPFRGSEDHSVALSYVFHQASRTPYAVAASEEMFEKMKAAVLSEGPVSPEVRVSLENSPKEKAAWLLWVSGFVLPVARDLDAVLLINRTRRPFITSDNPAVLWNPYLAARDVPGSHAGWGRLGIQAFMPLSESSVLAFYDSGTYRYARARFRRLVIRKDGDVDLINALQIIRADENIYLGPQAEEYYVRRLSRRYSCRRPAERVAVREYVELDVETRQPTGNTIIGSHAADVRLPHLPSFLRIRRRAMRKPIVSGADLVRNPSLTEEVTKRFMGERNSRFQTKDGRNGA